MFADGLVDAAAVSGQADGIEWLQALCQPFTPEATAEQTGIDADERRARSRTIWCARRGRPSTAGSVPASAGTALWWPT